MKSIKLTGLKKMIRQTKKEGIVHPSDYEHFRCKDLSLLHVRCLSQIVNKLVGFDLFTKSDISKSEFLALSYLSSEEMLDLLVINGGAEKTAMITTAAMVYAMNKTRSKFCAVNIPESKLDECIDAIDDYFGDWNYYDLSESLVYGVIRIHEEMVKQNKGVGPNYEQY